MSFHEHVQRAVKIVGSQKALADKTGLSQQGISWLLKEARQISAEIAVAIDRATEGQVSKAELRPDLFTHVTPESSDDGNKNHEAPPG